MMLPPLAEALHAAAGLVAAVLAGRNFDAALARAALPAPLRAATMDLAYPALRAFGRGDFLLGRLLERPLKDATARGLLLAALTRLEARPDEAHTTVDQAVTAAARLAHGQFKGLVNGVLRGFLRRREELLALADADPVARWQHPAWWIARLRQDHPAHWESILAPATAIRRCACASIGAVSPAPTICGSSPPRALPRARWTTPRS
jgi:16S rRNA (cytosine967-C5)-methyltransferase